MIFAVTYSTENYELMRKLNVKSAYSKGKADFVFEYTQDDIDDDFRKANKNILSKKRGAGLWLWKPYVINKALSLIKDGDYLIYSEAASVYINKIEHLVNSLNRSNQEIMVFDLPLISKQWTKKETFIRMECSDIGFEERNQIGASFILLKKSFETTLFFKEFLKICCDEIAISSDLFDPSILNSKNFLAHREDQSIFSILCMKYGLETFRDPSQFGKRPWQYIEYKNVIYNPVQYSNSNYPVIFLHTRVKLDISYLIKEMIKKFLTIFPFYENIEIYRRRNLLKKTKHDGRITFL
jgi:hypothetical protein